MNTSIDAMWDALWAPGYHALCAQTDGGQFTTIGHFDDPFRMMSRAEQLPDRTNVWFGVNGMEIPPAKGRGGADLVTAVTTMYADFDWRDELAHKGADLPSELEIRKRLAAVDIPPTVVVHTGHGLQAYWGIAETLDGGEGARLADGFNRWLEREFDLVNERKDLASVLRLPGTTNWKSDPIEVVIEAGTMDGYHAAWLFENCWIPETLPSTRLNGHSAAGLPATPLSVVGLSSHHDDSPLEWLRANFDPYPALLRQGWQPGVRRGAEEQMTRPGKDRRKGTSATYHHDERLLNIYSTQADPVYTHVGLVRNGCITVTALDVWMVENGQTNVSDAARLIRTSLMPQDRPRAVAVVPVDVPEAEPVLTEGTNLPEAFWTARGWLAHIRQAADNRQVSADAVLGAVITRYATVIPPMYRIPPIIMTASTFDHISVLVAESGGGKSGAMGIARELFPGPQERRDIVWDFPTPSGEGLVSAFFEMVDTEGSNGKTKSVNTKTKTAVHFSVDEALALVQTSKREGTTIGSVLCTAWSGGDPGQGNASTDRKRVGMNLGTYRMAGLASIQLSLGHKLLEDTFVQQGLSGRLVFFAAEDPEITHWSQRPEWPGEIEFPIPATMPLTLTYARSIEEIVLEQNYQKQTRRIIVAPIDSHLNLVALKLSGVFALMDGRTDVTESDWQLAQTVIQSHLTLRGRMLEMRKQAAHERTVSAATTQATFEDVRDDLKERKALARLRDSIIRHVPEEGIAKQALRKATTAASTRHRFEEAMAKALEDGAIKLDGERYYRG